MFIGSGFLSSHLQLYFLVSACYKALLCRVFLFICVFAFARYRPLYIPITSKMPATAGAAG